MKADHEPYVYRRHLRRCPLFGPGGRDTRVDKCSCPFHIDGRHNGRRVRESLKTRSRQIAERRLTEKIRELDSQADVRLLRDVDTVPGKLGESAAQRTVSEAVEHFLGTKGTIEHGTYRGDVERGTYRKYENSLQLLSSYCDEHGVSAVSRIDVDVLEDFRRTRKIGSVTWKVERQTLVTFFGYCLRRGWLGSNPAKELKAPRNVKPNKIVPYTLQEESRILAACDQIGGGKYNRSGARYEQLRARAMIMRLG
ncbi:MAG TPA: hypothetical protein VEV17_11840 [Bryobacteraceae bacterium]|nr:hypothetical protein [Bryobacteraceae bacterium]